jgi:hypothetical protein
MLRNLRSVNSETLIRLATMSLFCLTLCLVASLSTSAEEIALKDGTTIIGRVTRVNSDKIEVQTPNGKVQLNRSDILTISFPENTSGRALVIVTDKQVADKRDIAKNDETLSGTDYVNRTGGFSLKLPPGWVIDKDRLNSPAVLAGLSSKDRTRIAMVVREEYPGSLESYKDLTMLRLKRTLDQFEELAESNVTIDGKEAMLIFYRGVVPQSNELPVEFLSAIIPSGNGLTKITAWCVEPLFHDMQPTFEKIVDSYQSLSPVPAQTPNLP